MTSIIENGAALTFGTGYTASLNSQVLIDYERGMLRRVGGGAWPAGAVINPDSAYPYTWSGWAPGRQNVEVKYRGGWADGSAPADLVQWCIEEAINLKREPMERGVTSLGRTSVNQTRDRKLSPMADRARLRYAPWGRPRTYGG